MIVELLHKVAGMEMEEYQYRPRPSSAGPDRCIRQMVYQRTGVPPDRDIPNRLKHILSDGDWHDELTKEWIAKTVFKLHSAQMGVTLPLVFDWLPRKMLKCSICHQQVCQADFHGHIDGIVTDPFFSIDRLYEHKGLTFYVCERYATGKEFPEDYLAQTACYLKAIQRDNPDLTEALLVIKNKNSSSFLEYRLKYDSAFDCLHLMTLTLSDGTVTTLDQVRENIVRKVLEKFETVERYATEQTLPERPFDYSDWHCSFCRHQETCWAGYADELNSLAGEAELEPELADQVRYFQQLGAEIKEQEEERKELGKSLLSLMQERKLKKGRAGEYALNVVVQNKRVIDWATVPGSLQASIDFYKKPSPVAFVRVSKLKGK